MPFVMIPGLNTDARVYRDAAEALWPFGPVMVANHLAGEGISDIARRILDRAPSQFALAGFSFGGYLAFEVLRQARERVTRLALIDTSPRPDAAEATAVRQQRISQTRAGKFGLVVQQSFAASVHPDHTGDAELMRIHTEMSHANGREVYVRHQEAIIARPDSRPDLARIDVPTVVVVGVADTITPPDVAEEMAAGIPNSRLVVVEGAGHLSLLERPAEVSSALTEWASR